MAKPNSSDVLTIRDFDLIKWQNFPIAKLVDGPGAASHVRRLQSIPAKTATKTTGCVLAFRTVFDWHFTIYAYKWNGVEYAFAWESPHDETHRARSGTNAKPSDLLVQNFNFPILIDAGSPSKHYIPEPELQRLNDGVMFLDPSLART